MSSDLPLDHTQHPWQHDSHAVGLRLICELGSTPRTPGVLNRRGSWRQFNQLAVALMLRNNVAVKHGHTMIRCRGISSFTLTIATP